MAHNHYFQFKQFRIEQQHAAMRVGTDGVLLGSWCRTDRYKQALDIGCGTGLLSLMLAQRNPGLSILAIDIDDGALKDTLLNFERSPWADRLQAQQADLNCFASETTRRFDLIVCNPPYFSRAIKPASIERRLARHTETLSFDQLAHHVSDLLSEQGAFSVILPASEERSFCSLASWHRLFVARITRVRASPDRSPVRVLIEFKREAVLEQDDELIVETGQRHTYTDRFKQLVSDFYLNI